MKQCLACWDGRLSGRRWWESVAGDRSRCKCYWYGIECKADLIVIASCLATLYTLLYILFVNLFLKSLKPISYRINLRFSLTFLQFYFHWSLLVAKYALILLVTHSWKYFIFESYAYRALLIYKFVLGNNLVGSQSNEKIMV